MLKNKISFSKLLLFAVLVMITASCQGNLGNKLTKKLYKENLVDGTKLSQVIAEYGDYNSSWVGNNGVIYQYGYSSSKYDLISYLPLINHFGWINSENYEVLLTFDSKERLIAKQNFYNQAKSKNSLICNPEVYSCLKQVK